MKTVALTALVLALSIPVMPSGIGLLFFTVAVLAALSFKAHPVISGTAFSVNLLYTVMHIPGAVFEKTFFQGQVYLVHPETGVHWVYLAAQIPIMAAAFYLLLTKEEAEEEEDFIESLRNVESQQSAPGKEPEITLDIPKYREPPGRYHVNAE